MGGVTASSVLISRSVSDGARGCAALRKFDEMFELISQSSIDKADWTRMCAVPLTSYVQMSEGLGC